MSIVEAWGTEIGVTISTNKTVIMLKGSFARTPCVRAAGAFLPYVRSCRYLGITVSERMFFTAHIASLRQRMAGVVGALARVLRVDWGFSPRARRTIYAGLMVPCALIGASVCTGGAIVPIEGVLNALMSESELSASSRASSRTSSTTAARGRRRGRKSKANSISAPTQAKLLAVPGEGKPESVGVLEETALSSLEMPATTAATAAVDASDADVDDVIFIPPAPPAAAARAAAADVTGADAAATVVMDTPAAVPVRSTTPTRCLDRIVKGGAEGVLEEVGNIKEAFVGLVTNSSLNAKQAMELMRCINRYDSIVQALMVRNAVLEETSRLRATMPLPAQMPSAPVAVVNRPPVGYASAYPSLPVPSAAPVPAPRKPRDTWSAVVSSKDPKLTGREVAEKMRREIAPTLGVRLHEVRGLGRAIIRTPSSGEIKRVVASRKFGEIGLEVKPHTTQLPKLIVQDVATQIAPEEFMAELFANNLKEHIPEAEFRKAEAVPELSGVCGGACEGER
ncbi:hypothetical protein KR026_003283 [Drosophila bipectinata]|nr:hypothetical protein KR026_003283 [Drosophila bipectinata]